MSYAGDTALAQETVTAIRSDGFRVGAAVVLVNLVLLVLFLRALWAPLYLLAASILALAASLGLLTWLMQDLLGPRGPDVLRAVRGSGAAAVTRLGLQPLRRRRHPPRVAPAPGA